MGHCSSSLFDGQRIGLDPGFITKQVHNRPPARERCVHSARFVYDVAKIIQGLI
jgi:hypothetical protein